MPATLFLRGVLSQNVQLLASSATLRRQYLLALSVPVSPKDGCAKCRYTQPVCMKDLLQRFDTVLTPPALFKSSAARSIQLGTIDPAAVKKKYAHVVMLDSFLHDIIVWHIL